MGLQYRMLLDAAGLSVTGEYEDIGENRYFDTLKAKFGKWKA